MAFHHHDSMSLIIRTAFIFLKAHQVLLVPGLPRGPLARLISLWKYLVC